MNFDHLLIHTVHVASVATTNAKGVATYGAPVAVRARVLQRQSVVENADGEAVASTHVLQLTRALKPNDRVWLPGTSTSDPSVALTPLSVSEFPSLGGDTTLYEVAVG